MTDWDKIFDSVWCISYAKYADRRNLLKRELERVGLLSHEAFFWNITTSSIFDNIIGDSASHMGRNKCSKMSEVNLSLAHYSCIKSAYEMGHERILILEDDVKFMNDLDKIFDTLKCIPSDADVVLFSYNPCVEESLQHYVHDRRQSEKPFMEYTYVVYDSSCYALSRRGMEKVIAMHEDVMMPSDQYISKTVPNGLKSYIPTSPIAVQREFTDSIGGIHSYIYPSMGVSLSSYGISFPRFKGGTELRFRIIVPVWNSSATIERCIESIKRQSYDNITAVIVDDSSDDDSLEKIHGLVDGDDRFVIIESKGGPKCGGSARNIGLSADVESDYTLFLDSDDEYNSDDAVASIAYRLCECGYVDYLLCPFVFDRDGKIEMMHKFDSVRSAVKHVQYNAPWIACVKSNLVREFDDGVSAYDDVLQHFRQLDTVNTVSRVDSIIVRYHADGPNSLWNDDAATAKKIETKERSLVKTMRIAQSERFKHDYVRDALRCQFISKLSDTAARLSEKYTTAWSSIGISDCRRFYDTNRVLFATNGRRYKGSILHKSLRNYSFVTDSVYVVDYGKSGRYGYEALLDIFEHAAENGYHYIIYVDADCFITNHGNLKSEFEEFMKDGAVFSGVSDGGVICHRNHCRYAINPFLLFVNVDKLLSENHGKVPKFEYYTSTKAVEVRERTRESWLVTSSEYEKVRNSVDGFNIPHASLISSTSTDGTNIASAYGVGQHPWTYEDAHTDTERYYRIFIPMAESKRQTIRYMYASDYPLQCDKSGITSAVYASKRTREGGILVPSNVICLHSWYTRLYDERNANAFNNYHGMRIDAVADYAYSELLKNHPELATNAK